MKKGGQNGKNAQGVSAPVAGEEGPGSETERFRAITDLATTRRSPASPGPRKQRDHELRRQLNSLDEFS